MAIITPRPQLTLAERLYLPAIVSGMWLTIRHFFVNLLGLKKKFTLEYPDEKCPPPPGCRGAPTLVRDEDGREKCVACQLCEFVCPPRAIRVTPEALPPGSRHAKIEKRPAAFEINMLRCIYCGFCQEVCPEEAIFLREKTILTGASRRELVHDKQRLLALGGSRPDSVKKWKDK
ncbi:MAG: NADH-quinone oxidoreductase subunit I [Verrucomicrobiae bacterium]|nr:NADH-quinone oxidoreductase subunit I [Verrucomicrobiae bacterium]